MNYVLIMVIVGLISFAVGFWGGSLDSDQSYSDGNISGYAQGKSDCLERFVKVNS
jgi:hypothetical protein